MSLQGPEVLWLSKNHEQKLHKEKENPDKHYDYDTEFTKHLLSYSVSENRKVGDVGVLVWDAERLDFH